ncbi:hypothetical protein [Umboniibacter marinipuniceus]|uniref:DUF2306 domain-containing protein n=1 Tax=Umboniibacter marinipuniceus TaxID=569599 RepID=A0A3M0A4P8_9GAMM|nr:hypothetical protein [Umboniibacter marinipuniceus]RMA80141.1 hypothetical protein DFR27_1504 [Umboniibacter marinipuniceus]
MPLSAMGIFHTLVGLIAIITAVQQIWTHKQILAKTSSGKIYLAATVLTAVSALTIFKHGGFNTAHALAILTLAATVTGVILESTKWFGGWNKYLRNICYTATLLFHALPTATEILTRFPMDAPVVSSLQDPLLQKVFLVILVVWLIGLVSQLVWLKTKAK